MRDMKKSVCILVLLLTSLLFAPATVRANEVVDADSMQISLLTCGPGSEVYELYGHTALRVRHEKTGADWVFNYGIFDFNAPHFTWRFMLGKADYMMGVQPFDAFLRSYRRAGRYVDEQTLNLTPVERTRLVTSLMEIWEQTGWTYRYNFLYDNCTTRAVDQIVSSLDGQVVWPDSQGKELTFRQMIHEFAAEASPWNCFGQDLVLGAEVDRPIGVELQLFSPVYAERFLDEAYVQQTDGTRRPLVQAKHRLVEAAPLPEGGGFPVSPMGMALLLLSVVGVWSYMDFRRGKPTWVIDYVLMAVQGLTGCLVALLFFFSAHPAVDSNWLIALLNPLPLLFLPWMVWNRRHGRRDYFWVVQVAGWLVLILSSLCGWQKIPAEFHVLALLLLVRIVTVQACDNRCRKLER